MAPVATDIDTRRASRRNASQSRTHVPNSHRFAHYVARPLFNRGPLLFATVVIGVLVVAWLQREEGYLTAESGLGYWFGIVGGIMMLILIGYPLRKRLASLSRAGRIANWFRLHMVLGIVGPTLVVLHTNFKLGSMNSRLALLTMLIVVASGVVGRYLYAKVHRGLYGQHAAMRDVLEDIAALRIGLGDEIGRDAVIISELSRLAPSTDDRTNQSSEAPTFFKKGLLRRNAHERILHRAKEVVRADTRLSRTAQRRLLRQFRKQLRIYFAAVRKAERLAMFERIFGLWHHLHMPLFVMLAFTVTLHIVAVHRY